MHIKGVQTTTQYFADENIGDGDKILEEECTEFEDGVKTQARYTTMIANHDKSGLQVVEYVEKCTFPELYVWMKCKDWFPATDEQLQTPETLIELGIPQYTIRASSFFSTFPELDSTLGIGVRYHEPNEDDKSNKPEKVVYLLYVKEGMDEAEAMIVNAKNNDGEPIFKKTEKHYPDYYDYVPAAPSIIDGVEIYSYSPENVEVTITLKDVPSTEANELAPFIALVE